MNDKVFVILMWGVVVLTGFCLSHFLYRLILGVILFKGNGNPFRRTCRRCGSCQEMYISNVEGEEDMNWWEEHFSGDDPNCKCHSFAVTPPPRGL